MYDVRYCFKWTWCGLSVAVVNSLMCVALRQTVLVSIIVVVNRGLPRLSAIEQPSQSKASCWVHYQVQPTIRESVSFMQFCGCAVDYSSCCCCEI
jgi:hypothetical protein